MPFAPIDRATARRAARSLLALDSPVRREVIRQLADGPRPRVVLAERVGVSPRALGYHLQVLRRAGYLRLAAGAYHLRPGLLDPADDPAPVLRLRLWGVTVVVPPSAVPAADRS